MNISVGYKGTLGIVVKEWLPFVRITRASNSGAKLELSGPMAQLLDYLCKELHIKYFLKENSEFGKPQTDGSWNGLIGMLIRKEVNMSITPLTISQQRKDVIDFSTPFFVSPKTLLVGRPSFHTPLFGIVEGLNWKVSVIILCSMLLTLCIMFLFRHIQLAKCEKRLAPADEIWIMVEVLFGKSLSNLPTSMAKRMLLISWMLPIWVLTIAMCSELICALSTTTSNEIRKLSDILKHPRVQPIFSEGSSEAQYFKTVTSWPYRDIYQRSLDMPGSYIHGSQLGTKKILDGVAQNRFALINDRVWFEDMLNVRYTQEGACSNFIITEPYIYMYMGLGFAQGTNESFVKDVNKRILNMVQYGLLEAALNEVPQPYIKCLQPTDTGGFRQENIFEIRGIFILWSFGIAVAAISCVVEYLLQCLYSRDIHKTFKKEKPLLPYFVKISKMYD